MKSVLRRLRSRQPENRPGSLEELARRPVAAFEGTALTPPMMQADPLSAGVLKTLRRFFVWVLAFSSFLAANSWDQLRGKNSEARRALRLRRIMERSGGAARKIGRLLAGRIDFLPWGYCVELSKIPDKMAPFPIEDAIAKTEAATGQSLVDSFTAFDPAPIVSSTISCVYQAVLRDGRKVAVKVRRPRVGELLMADLKSLHWLLKIGEFLSLIRLGVAANLYHTLYESLDDEMNFVYEARNQMLFRREAKRTGKKFFTAPKVYFELSSSEVIIEEFVSGMWLWELLRAVEQSDEAALERAREFNIDASLVAKRLLWVNFWGLDEHLLFLADISPDRVIVCSDSKLTFIDFSSVGALSQEKRQALQQLRHYAWKRDPLEMARSSMILLEPLPPIDTIQFTRDLEERYWKFLYALESRRVRWWERTSARMWLSFIQSAREQNISMNIQVQRMVRASLLFDMLAARLDKKVDHIKEYRRFTRYRAKSARRRIEKRVRRLFDRGVEDRFFLQVEEITDTGGRLFRQAQRLLSTPVLKFNAVLDKPVYTLSILLRLIGQSALVTGIAAGLMSGLRWLMDGQPLKVMEAIAQAATHPVYVSVILFLAIINIRAIVFRLGDKEI